MVKTAEAKCYFVTRKEELGYFLDTFMGAALYFCSVLMGGEKRVLKRFVKFFYVLLGFLFVCLFFWEERSGPVCCRKSNWTLFFFFFGY